MNNIFVTQQQKEEWEAKVAELETFSPISSSEEWLNYGQLNLYKELLSKAIVLLVEESWDDVFSKTFSQAFIEKDYPNGVIIKQTT